MGSRLGFENILDVVHVIECFRVQRKVELVLFFSLLVEDEHVSKSSTKKNGGENNSDRVFLDLFSPSIKQLFEFFVHEAKDGLTPHIYLPIDGLF